MKRKAIAVSIFGIALVLGTGEARAQSSFRSPERVDTTVVLGKDGTLSISIYSGRVNVTGASGNNVHIRGTAEREELSIRSREGRVSVSLEPDHGRGGRAEFDVTVPIGTNVVLEGFSAPFTVKGVKGEVKIESLSGDVDVTDASGLVQIETVGGDISATNVDGDVHAEAVSGSVTLTSINGTVDTETVGGRISMTRMKSRSIQAETVGGSITYIGSIEAMGNYVLKSHSGRITLGIPPNAGATVGLETFSGTVDSDFPMTLEAGTTRANHESKYTFRIGDGKSRVILETFSGNVMIQRGTQQNNQEQ